MNHESPRYAELLLQKPKAVILGSFRFYSEIQNTRERFERNGIEVLMPRAGEVVRVDEATGYQILDTDGDKTPDQIQSEFFDAIEDADLAYLVTPNGYIGNMVTIELGYTMGSRKPIYSNNPISLENHAFLPYQAELFSKIIIATPEEAAETAKQKILGIGQHWVRK
jgi:hypothetical protein